MREEPKPKPNQDHSGQPWGIFFHNEFQKLKMNTGLLQWEKFNEAGISGKQQARELIANMILECKVPAYARIKREVLQRVISAAVLDDKEFIGFNVKFIRKTLAAWWKIYGDKIIIEMNRIDEEERERQKPPPTMNPHLDVHYMVESYKQSLANDTTPPQSDQKENRL